MPTMNRQGIIDNVVATIDALTAAALIAGTGLTSTTTINRIERKLIIADDVGDAVNFDAACVIPAESQPPPKYYPFGDIRKELDYWVIVHAAVTSETHRTQRVAEVERDVRCALAADPKRGGYAIETIEAESEISDEGWSELLASSGTGVVSVVMKFRSIYYPNDGGA